MQKQKLPKDYEIIQDVRESWNILCDIRAHRCSHFDIVFKSEDVTCRNCKNYKSSICTWYYEIEGEL